MKAIKSILFFLTISFFYNYSLFSQVTIHQEGFEGSDYVGYTTSTPFQVFNTGSDYFLRGDGSSLPPSAPPFWPGITGYEGINHLLWEDADGYVGELVVTLDPVSIAGYNTLTVKWGVAAPKTCCFYDDVDYMILEYNIDGGGWIKAGECRGDAAVSGNFRHDDNHDGTTTGQGEFLLGTAMQFFTYNIPTTGSSMQVRVRSFSGIQEEMALDDIEIRGVAVAPSNDDCANAINITTLDGTCTNYDFNNATPDVANGVCVEGNNNVWFTFTAQGTTVDITVSGIDRPEFALVEFGTACSGVGAIVIDCQDLTGAYTSISATNIAVTTGTEYTIIVTNNNNTNGTFDLCVNNPLSSCEITSFNIGTPVQCGNTGTYGVDVTWVGGFDASVSLVDANATFTGDDPATVANGTATLIYNIGTDANVAINDSESLCSFSNLTATSPTVTPVNYMETDGDCTAPPQITLPAGYTCTYEYLVGGTHAGNTGSGGVATYPAALVDGDSGTVEFTITTPCGNTETVQANFICVTCNANSGSWN